MPLLKKTSTRKAAVTGVRSEVRQFMHRLSALHMRRRASRALRALSDSELKDIGLHRSEVDSRLIDMAPERPRRRACS